MVVAILLTCWVIVELLGEKMESPAKNAMRSKIFASKVDAVNAAVPECNGALPKVLSPDLNVTISPSGTNPVLDFTTAVKVMGWPKDDGFGAEVIVVTVGTELTT